MLVMINLDPLQMVPPRSKYYTIYYILICLYWTGNSLAVPLQSCLGRLAESWYGILSGHMPKTHFGYTFTIPTSGNLFMWLGSVYWSALVPAQYIEVIMFDKCLSTHAQRICCQCGLRRSMQISLPGIYIERTYEEYTGLDNKL